jgi:hypothetical protein
MSSTRLRETVRKEDGKLYAAHEKKIRSRQFLNRNEDVRFVVEKPNCFPKMVADYNGTKDWKTISAILEHLREKGFTANAYARVCIEEADMHPEIEIPAEGSKSFGDYVEAALWSSNMTVDDEDGDETTIEELSRLFSIEDLEEGTRRNLYSMWERFQKENETLLAEAMEATGNDLGQAAHDLWLTSGGHGCGFWDGDWDTEARDYGKELTAIAKRNFCTEQACWWLDGGKLALDGMYHTFHGVNLTTMEVERFPAQAVWNSTKTLYFFQNPGHTGVRIDTVTTEYDNLSA